MDSKIEQCVCNKFCGKLGKSATETLEMLREAFGEHWSTSKTAENVEKIRELIHEDHRRTIHELADTVGISYGVYQEILTENLNMCHIARPHVPENHRVCD
jgi:hypothetical protein